jgi:flagellar protein FliS
LAYKNAYSVYNQTKILTASQGQLIIMLYDGALKNLDNAISFMEGNTGDKVPPEIIEKTGRAIIKAQSIISELSSSLDFEKGGDVAKELFALYTWFGQELLDANVNKDANRVKNVREMLANLRTSWLEIIEKEPMRAAATSPYTQQAMPMGKKGVNISG